VCAIWCCAVSFGRFALSYLHSADGAEYDKDNDDELTDIARLDGQDTPTQKSAAKATSHSKPHTAPLTDNAQPRNNALLYVANDEVDDDEDEEEDKDNESQADTTDSDDEQISDSDLDMLSDDTASSSSSSSSVSSKPWSIASLFLDLQSISRHPEPLPSTALQSDSSSASSSHWSSALLPPSDIPSSSSSSSLDSSLLSLLSSWRSLAFRLKQLESSKLSQLTNSLQENVEEWKKKEKEMEKYVERMKKSTTEEEKEKGKESNKNLIIRVSEVKPADVAAARARRKQQMVEQEEDEPNLM